MSPRDPNTILACLAGAAACTLFYGTFRVLGYIGRLLWAKRAVPLDPVDAQLDSNPVEERGDAIEQTVQQITGLTIAECFELEDLRRWQTELLEEPAIRKYTRRMDKR